MKAGWEDHARAEDEAVGAVADMWGGASAQDALDLSAQVGEQLAELGVVLPYPVFLEPNAYWVSQEQRAQFAARDLRAACHDLLRMLNGVIPDHDVERLMPVVYDWGHRPHGTIGGRQS